MKPTLARSFFIATSLMIFSISGCRDLRAGVHAGKGVMNDISFENYKNFLQDWTLVTIRFRKDTGEMRLTYANKIALETLQVNGYDFKEGAVIAKTGIATSPDPSFTSSIVPRFIRRYQLMVKDKKKYKDTNGWGYALFDPEGKTFPEDPIETQQSCHACHSIVEDQGYVFSRPFSFAAPKKFISFRTNTKTVLSFEEYSRNNLSKSMIEFVPKQFEKVSRLVFDKLSKNIFQGALDELKPILEEEVLTKRRPAFFISADSLKFVLVVPNQVKTCAFDSGVMIHMTTLTDKIFTETLCLHD